MNDKKRLIVGIWCLIASPLSLCGFAGLLYPEKTESTAARPLSSVERQVNTLEKEKRDLEHLRAAYAQERDKLGHLSGSVKEKLKAQPNQATFFQKKLSIISQLLQELNDLQKSEEQLQGLIDQELSVLKNYATDQRFENLKKPRKASYSFDDLQELGERLVGFRNRISELEKSKVAATEDLNKRKKTLAVLNDEYKEKERLQEEFSSNPPVPTGTDRELSLQQQGELLDEQKRLALYKKDLADIKAKEADHRFALIEAQLAIARDQAGVIKEDYTRVKQALIVDEDYIHKVEQELEAKRQLSVTRRDRLQEKIAILIPLREELKKKLEEALKQFGIPASELATFEEWDKEPTSTAEWLKICTIGNLSTRIFLVEAEREYLEAQIELEKAKFRLEEIGVETLRSWHTMTRRTFSVDLDKEITQEIKKYETPRAELQADLAIITERRNGAINLLHQLNVLLDKVKALSTQLKANPPEEWKDRTPEYRNCLQLLYQSEEHIRKRIDMTAKLIESYSNTIAVMGDSIKRIEGVVAELSTKSFWRRSNQSIEWRELQHFLPDLRRFFFDLQQSTTVASFFDHIETLVTSIKQVLALRGALFLLIIRFIMIGVIFVLLRLYIPDSITSLSSVGRDFGKVSTLSLATATILRFLWNHIAGLYIWFVLFFLLRLGVIADSYFAIWFYLLSIPYFLLLSYRFIAFFLQANQQHGFIFISESYQRRFMVVVSSLAYATVILLLLREAFLLGNYSSSQVSTILLALNYIVLQIALMSLMGKQQILSAIPSHTPMWEWVKEHVSKYYYLLWLCVIAIIIMSNPYVGYGRQVLYVLSRVALTASLIPLFLWVHNRIKRVSSDLFFYYSDGEVIKERFSAGRTWYGLFVFISFLLFVLVGILLIGQIWGYSISLRDISSWLKYELYSPGVDEAGRRIHVTGISLFKIVLFVVGGAIVTYIINHFVLRRIFDPLLVGSGVQNTILTLSRYVIIFMSLLMGLQSAGLDAMTTKIVLALGALSFALKDPIGDFFAYFIILVQRPVKIGDLIMIDDNVTGVVRHITPRSVVLRRRNSVTVIVPNSQIITRPTTNWNYTRSFFAFNDMLITVPYTADPQAVQQLLFKVLDGNINILKNPAPLVWLNDFTDNGFQFLVRGFLTADKVLEQWEISSQIRLEIVRLLRVQGYDIASPTRNLRIVSSAPVPIQIHQDNME
jgi:small-conductance mechanosensitive channel